ncbi:hypothetical protein EVAR_42720_1 [Eumeta japonica]|uniref:Uncharacterized protein n=1 Tax=Eumeta variegata TaxID=151549 RepID=A0A4C1XG93_EUMVA|nr:hypothetical protein EVAR_42720_1 [Eumeta japonica]
MRVSSVELSALFASWLGRAFVAYSSEYITKINLLAYTRVQLPGAAAGQAQRGRRVLSALAVVGRACLVLPAKLNAAGGLQLSALALWLGRAFIAYSSEYITKLNLLVYMRVFSCLGLLPTKIDATGGLRLSALSLWLGRAFIAYSSEYITNAKPLGLHARVQLPGAVGGQDQRGRRAAAQRALAVARPRVRCVQ